MNTDKLTQTQQIRVAALNIAKNFVTGNFSAGSVLEVAKTYETYIAGSEGSSEDGTVTELPDHRGSKPKAADPGNKR